MRIVNFKSPLKLRLERFLVLATAAVSLALLPRVAVPCSSWPPEKGWDRSHYLMLVSQLKASTYTPERLALFDKSPYDGLAMEYLGAYDVTPIPTASAIVSQLTEARKSTSKDIWPWVYLNRMLGRDPDFDNKYSKDPYFYRIQGADLENTTGAQDDFIHIWENSLRAAREVHTPGIVIDLEFYSNYKAYNPLVLAKEMGKSPQETMELLRKLGVRMANTAAKEYPEAAFWFLFTDLGQLGDTVVDGVKYYPSPAYIVMGLLDEIRVKNYHLKVIDGGEVGLEYCSLTLNDLKRKISGRVTDYGQNLEKNKRAFEFAGTMILWKDRESKTDFMTSGVCAKCDAATVEDLQPYLETLLRSYRYNWIYATYYAGYDPFHPRSAPRFDAMIRKAEADVYGEPTK